MRNSDGCLITIAIIVILVLGSIFSWGAYLQNRAERTAVQVIEKTFDGENVIYNYEWFLRQYNDYKSFKDKVTQAQTSIDNYIKLLPTDREKWKSEDKAEVSRLMSIKDGFDYQLKNIISEYNAKSKMVNRNIFKDKSLPEELK